MQFEVSKNCSEPFHAGAFRAKCMSEIGAKNVDRQRVETSAEEVAKTIEVDEETAKEIIDICDPSNLKCPLEEKQDMTDAKILKNISPQVCPLQTVKLAKGAVRRNELRNFMHNIWDSQAETNDDERGDIEDGTVILSAMLYHPTKQNKEQGYLVLAGQYLTELKDKIECLTDRTVLQDRSHNPEFVEKFEKNSNKSGFFFVEGTFYNDMRDPYNRDYSSTIIEWAKVNYKWNSERLGSFKSKRMEETKFEELKIRLGYPYYYCHQGNCEHLLIFNDMRLIHADDPKYSSMYPSRSFKNYPTRTKCSMCTLLHANWITTNDAFAFEDPSFFCNQCFDLLHYDENKKKLHSFEAYPFDGCFNP